MATIDTDVQSAGVRRVLWITLALNLAVSAGKVIVGHLSGSLAMVADGYHSLVDGSNNVIGLIVAAFAFAPPDRAHPYGHRKFETAATLIIGIALLALAWEVFSGALGRTAKPALPEIGLLNWVVMAVDHRRQPLRELVRGARGPAAQERLPRGRRHAHAGRPLRLARRRGVSSWPPSLGLGWADPLVAVAIAAIIAWQARADPPLRLQRPHRPRGHPGRDARAAGGGGARRPARPRRAQPRPPRRRLRGPHRPPRRGDEPAPGPRRGRPHRGRAARRPTPRSWTWSSTSSPRATRARPRRGPDSGAGGAGQQASGRPHLDDLLTRSLY